ncbi:MAG: aspartyl/glutamyl-tRNA amidotransferase subunit C [Gemmatimonadetes bacterium]|nr:aspartyl/glutamyl-tRNA amidotransferase subunit C [Gemmatimonadota bacterium]
MAITDDDVRHIAALARLGLPGGRVAALVHELNGILGHMAVLQRVSTDMVRDAGDPRPPLVSRPDVRDADQLARPLADFAPDVRGGLILVPRLGTHDDAEES